MNSVTFELYSDIDNNDDKSNIYITMTVSVFMNGILSVISSEKTLNIVFCKNNTEYTVDICRRVGWTNYRLYTKYGFIWNM